ncbi:MAG: hypothetical protein OXU61_11540 [Gammaproteobacteria bacterium]|nr:hypothetical protein [Gammaproteobacteria bacterium]
MSGGGGGGMEICGIFCSWSSSACGDGAVRPRSVIYYAIWRARGGA